MTNLPDINWDYAGILPVLYIQPHVQLPQHRQQHTFLPWTNLPCGRTTAFTTPFCHPRCRLFAIRLLPLLPPRIVWIVYAYTYPAMGSHRPLVCHAFSPASAFHCLLPALPLQCLPTQCLPTMGPIPLYSFHSYHPTTFLYYVPSIWEDHGSFTGFLGAMGSSYYAMLYIKTTYIGLYMLLPCRFSSGINAHTSLDSILHLSGSMPREKKTSARRHLRAFAAYPGWSSAMGRSPPFWITCILQSLLHLVVTFLSAYSSRLAAWNLPFHGPLGTFQLAGVAFPLGGPFPLPVFCRSLGEESGRKEGGMSLLGLNRAILEEALP